MQHGGLTHCCPQACFLTYHGATDVVTTPRTGHPLRAHHHCCSLKAETGQATPDAGWPFFPINHKEALSRHPAWPGPAEPGVPMLKSGCWACRRRDLWHAGSLRAACYSRATRGRPVLEDQAESHQAGGDRVGGHCPGRSPCFLHPTWR